MTRKITIKCDGGFGNRYNSLLSGIVLARIFGLDYNVIWPKNNACMADPSSLFERPLTIIEETDLRERTEYLNLFHFEKAPHQVAGDWICQMKDMNEVSDKIHSTSRDILFSTSLVPHFYDLGLIGQVMDGLGLAPALRLRAEDFIAERRLGPFIGLHLRRTDFMADEAQDQAIEAMIRQRVDLKFFVCSDSQAAEVRMRPLSNVFTYPKTSYVDKLQKGGWRMDFVDKEGLKQRFNVLREAESVEQALVDLLILSRSELVDTSSSTFLKTAMLMRAKERRLLRFSETYGQHFYRRELSAVGAGSGPFGRA